MDAGSIECVWTSCLLSPWSYLVVIGVMYFQTGSMHFYLRLMLLGLVQGECKPRHFNTYPVAVESVVMFSLHISLGVESLLYVVRELLGRSCIFDKQMLCTLVWYDTPGLSPLFPSSPAPIIEYTIFVLYLMVPGFGALFTSFDDVWEHRSSRSWRWFCCYRKNPWHHVRRFVGQLRYLITGLYHLLPSHYRHNTYVQFLWMPQGH